MPMTLSLPEVPVENCFFNGGDRWAKIGDEPNTWTHLVNETIGIPGRDSPIFPVFQTPSGFSLDRDSIIRGINDRDFKLRVHFAKPLQIQG
jgi:hypothetical protein